MRLDRHFGSRVWTSKEYEKTLTDAESLRVDDNFVWGENGFIGNYGFRVGKYACLLLRSPE